MSVLSDIEITKLSIEEEMISPFSQSSVGISSGVSSYGYDSKLANKLFLFSKRKNDEIILDPKKFDPNAYEEIISDDYFILGPHDFALGRTLEYFKIPSDILVICVGKSTYARCGMIVNVTPLEPGWEGYVTLEFSNTTPYPIKIYVNEGICQFLFLKGHSQCKTTYDQKKGKYMKQKDIVLPKEF